MRPASRRIFFAAVTVGAALWQLGLPAPAQSPPSETSSPSAGQLRSVSVLDGLRSGDLTVAAQGTGDGRVALSITNRTPRTLQVVLPTELVAASASGQYGIGGFGGFGGGGFGGLGYYGGLGYRFYPGFGAGFGGLTGLGGVGVAGFYGPGISAIPVFGMGPGNGVRPVPPVAGMGMLSNVFMNSTGGRDSWDVFSYQRGVTWGPAGPAVPSANVPVPVLVPVTPAQIAAARGRGLRSVPVTQPASATLAPGQTRHLPTRVVSFNGPDELGRPKLPEKGETLLVGDVAELTGNPVMKTAITRLADEKAPETVAQLVMWRVIAKLNWRAITSLSKRWANPSELALARQFVNRLDKKGIVRDEESGVVYVEVKTENEADPHLARGLRPVLEEIGLLGLNVESNIPRRPDGPALACRVSLSPKNVADVSLFVSSPRNTWVSAGQFSVPFTQELPAEIDAPSLTSDERLQVRGALLADSIAEAVLARLVQVQLRKGRLDHGQWTYQIQIDNVSPMILNGLAISGTSPAAADAEPSSLGGFSLPPHKRLTVPAGQGAVDRLHLEKGVKAIAADLSVL